MCTTHSMVIALILSAAIVTTGHAADDPPAPTTVDELQQRISQVLEQTNTPGVGFALVKGGEVLWQGGVGVADRESGEPVTADTVFRIGSISKTFVALLALMLVEDGILDLNAPLREVAPEVAFTNPWADTAPVRIVHLLEHTTGWDDMAPRDYAHNAVPPFSLRQGLDYNPASRVSRWPPGRSTSYCNSGPAVAAYVMEKLTGRDFEALVRERLFEPLGMQIADFRLSPTIAERLATGYFDGRAVDYWHLSIRPSGSINASARDMAAFVRLFLNRGSVGDELLLPTHAIERTQLPRSNRAARAGLRTGYGLNTFTIMSDGFVFHGHGGAMQGYLSEFGYAPGQDVGYVYMLNATSGPAVVQIGKLIRGYLTAGLDPPAKPAPAVVPAAILAGYAGWYEPITPRVEIGRFAERLVGLVRLTVTDDGLLAAPLLGEPRRLVGVTERLFRAAEDPLASVAFHQGDAQGIATLGIAFEARKVPAALVWAQLGGGGFALLAMLSALGFAGVWVPRWLFGNKLRSIGHLSVRALPALSAGLFFSAALILATANEIHSLGNPTLASVSLWLLLWLFAGTAVLALVQVIRRWSAPVNLAVRFHSLLVALGATTVAGYLLYWGIIGWRTWA